MRHKNQGALRVVGLIMLLAACRPSGPAATAQNTAPAPEKAAMEHRKSTPETAAPWQDSDLVSLAEIDPTLRIELRFATAAHPFGATFYRSNTAFLRYGTAKKLSAVQRELHQKGLGLKIWDAYRPFAVQVALFHAAGGNPNWVSDPYRTAGKKTHVRGVAVDCTIVDASGNELNMPTPYLDFQNGADKMKHTYTELPRDVLANRKLLKETMIAQGMEPYLGEWWHYQDTNWGNYPIVQMDEFPEVHRRLLVDNLLLQEQSSPPSQGKGTLDKP